jgi:N-acyl-D-amino-acid deacylase
MHTRLHGLTNLAVALPPWVFAGGKERFQERLRDPGVRSALKNYESLIRSLALGGWDRVSLFTSAKRADLVGLSFQQIAKEMGTTPFDAVLDVLFEEADDPYFPLCLCESYTETQLCRAHEHPACMVASDATALCPRGTLENPNHWPKAWCTFW